MKTIRWSVFLLLSFLLLVSACQPAQATEPTQPSSPLTGLLSELSGQVNAKQADQADFHAARPGDELAVNGQVQTGDNGRARVDLSSGTIIRVAPSSQFTLVSNEEVQGGLATKIKLELGRIFIILSGGSTDVEAPSGVASIRGSYMMVEIDPITQNVVITCLEGHCSAGGIDFSAGQKVTFEFDPATGTYRPPQLEKMTGQDFELWLEYNPEAQQVLNQLQAAATTTRTPTPMLSPSPTGTQTTFITDSEPGCFSLQAPPDGALINSSGLVTFTWDAQEGAAHYEVTFTSPGNVQNTLITTGNSLSNYIDIFPSGGVYSWEVTAVDNAGQVICTAKAFAFSKPAATIEQTPPNNNTTCTVENAQSSNPNEPCYCKPGANSGPSYCRIPKPTATPRPTNTRVPPPTRTPLPSETPTPTYYPGN